MGVEEEAAQGVDRVEISFREEGRALGCEHWSPFPSASSSEVSNLGSLTQDGLQDSQEAPHWGQGGVTEEEPQSSSASKPTHSLVLP